jgi:hypothetical protein
LSIYDGTVDEVRLYEYSHGSILGGSVSSVVAGHESSVDISDGIFDLVLGAGNTHISITGGQFNGFMFVEGDNYIFEMSGGYTGVVDGSGAGYTAITGGEIDVLVSNLSGTVEVFGGQINHLGVGDYSDSGLIIIHGTNFNFDYGYITDFSGILTGTLLSGETILADFERYGDAQILLVPEPATLLLFGLGGLVLRKRWK